MYNKYLLFLFCTINTIHAAPKLITCDTFDDDNGAKKITITFTVPEKDFIYKDFITCCVHEPEVTLSTWAANKQSISHYDPSFKDTKQIFNETFSITMLATQKEYNPHTIHLYCTYYRKSEKRIGHALFTFTFPQALDTNIQINNANIELYTQAPDHKSQSSYSSHSFIDKYYVMLVTQTHRITAFFMIHHKKCVSFLVIFMCILFVLFYFYQQPLQKHKKFYELIDATLIFCVTISAISLLIYLYTTNKPPIKLIITSISVIFFAITGIFYIKKSTKLQSGYLRTFFSFIGMLFVASTMLLAFKVLQFVDGQFQLFP